MLVFNSRIKNADRAFIDSFTVGSLKEAKDFVKDYE